MSLFRRSSHLVSSWNGSQLELTNYATGVSAPVDAVLLDVLDALDGWTSRAELEQRLGGESGRTLDERLRWAVERTFVHATGSRVAGEERALDRWGKWNPPTGFFHSATRDVPFSSVAEQQRARSVVDERSPVPALKAYETGDTIRLEPAPRDEEVTRTLLERRSWRRFADASVGLDSVSAVLELTWGVQSWFRAADGQEAALKTSPSGGARHSIEVYLVARAVRGLANGSYHYDPDGHRLRRLESADDNADVGAFFPAQPWFHGAAAYFFMTSRLDRVQWRYRFPRAYRVVHLEAGHLGQTFCLLATRMGLAPFSTAALADGEIEEHLGLSWTTEPVLYAVGVGVRPSDGVWPGTPAGGEAPPTRRSSPDSDPPP